MDGRAGAVASSPLTRGQGRGVRRGLGIATLIVAAMTFATAPIASAAATDFPAGYEGYHTYAEVDAELDAAVAEYGQGAGAILTRHVIGQSFEGRDIWAVKISDNVATDEDEPEVLSESGMHAREHISVEMALYMIRLLTENYGLSTAMGQRVTSIVNSREIWVIPIVNPDGTEYNISDGVFHGWRKNRQPNPGSDEIGIDLNRNWSYKWNCCGGASTNPRSSTYGGRHPFEAVENVVLRDFILSRRIGGEQQITIVFNWHAYGEFIYWPYGYTEEDIPPTMTSDDHATFVAIGQRMATLNGYTARQGSDSYIYDGDFPAWAYGDQRMFVYTFEMYPKWDSQAGGFSPPDEVIERETTRNTEAVLYFLEQADCPYRAAGLGATRCGPMNEDFETDRGWTFNPFGSDTAGSGAWQRGIPEGTTDARGIKQRSTVSSGQAALVTGAAAGGSSMANDLDGSTTALSRPFTLASGAWRLAFRYTFAHDGAATKADFLRVSVVNGAKVTALWTVKGSSTNRNARWLTRKLKLNKWAGKSIRLLIEARDGDADNLVEAAIDDLRVFRR